MGGAACRIRPVGRSPANVRETPFMVDTETVNPELQAGATQAPTPVASSDNQRGTQDEALVCGLSG